MMAIAFLEGIAQRLGGIGEACRRAVAGPAAIEAGPAAGLRFDAGTDTLRFQKGDYERPVQQALASLARPGDICYDIGANLGFFSILLGRLVGATGMVYAFEPVPANAAAIERNACLNDLANVCVARVALTRSDGEAELLLAQHVGGAVLAGAGIPPDPAGRLTVATAAVDSLVARGELTPPRIVKIDVEGAEMDVLKGMERTLSDHAPAIVLELDDATESRCHSKADECRIFLEDHGYRVENLPSSYIEVRWFVRHLVAIRSVP